MSSTEDSTQNDTYEDAAGTSYESMVITTDSLEELTQEMSTELAKLTVVGNMENTPAAAKKADEDDDDSSTVVEEEELIKAPSNDTDGESSKSIISNEHQRSIKTNTISNKLADDEESSEREIDYLHDSNWLNQNEHVFILSTAGKPIYSLHGSEDKLATLYGVMQALVSVFQSNQDTLMSIHAIGIQFVYLVRPPLILVAASRKRLSVQQIQLQLT